MPRHAERKMLRSPARCSWYYILQIRATLSVTAAQGSRLRRFPERGQRDTRGGKRGGAGAAQAAASQKNQSSGHLARRKDWAARQRDAVPIASLTVYKLACPAE